MRIQYAPDSGSTEEAKLLRKNANLTKMGTSISHSADLEIPICSNILIGYPGQKKKNLIRTIIFAIKLSWYLSLVRFGILFVCLILNYTLRPKRLWRTYLNVKNKKPVTYFENLLYLKLGAGKNSLKQYKEIVIDEFSGLR